MADNPRIEELRKRLEKEPGSRLFAQLAEELRKAGELEEAIRVSREGLQKHPAYPSARMTLGRALLDTGDAGGARGEFEAVLKSAPDNILASRFLAECLETLGDLRAALARYKTTLLLAAGDKALQMRIEGLEARLRAPAALEPASRGRAADAAEGAAGAGSAEPPPFPVSAADEAFELERPHEAAPSVVGGVRDRAAASTRGVEPEALIEPEPVVEPAEPAPIPVVAADEGFELEGPYEAPAGRSGQPAATAAPRPAPAPDQTLSEAGEVDAPTLPFGRSPVPDVPGPAAVWPTAPPKAATEESPEIISSTLAELYFNQGFTEKAIDVYRQLLDREPRNDRARARLQEIESLERHLRAEEKRPAPTAGAPAVPLDPRAARREAIERTIVRLEGLLAAIKRG